MDTNSSHDCPVNKREKDFLLLLGYNYLKGRKFKQATVIYNALYHLYPDDKHFSLFLSFLYLQIKEYEKSLLFADQYLAREGNHQQGHFIKGRALFEQGLVDEAKSCAKKVLIN
jgi:tetratricopeptide (TPR) repeat protein